MTTDDEAKTELGAQLRPLLHDLKQPLNLIRVVAQEIRLDVRKGRLEAEALPERMLEIEHAVDQAVAAIDRLPGALHDLLGRDDGDTADRRR